MRFNSFKQLSTRDADDLRERVMGAFYARHPAVLNAVQYDSLGFGSLTEKTRKMVRTALDQDAGMRRDLESIAASPLRTATAYQEIARQYSAVTDTSQLGNTQ